MPTKVVLVVPPDELLKDCEVAPPPLLWQDKQVTDAYNAQTFNITKCNDDKYGLRKWKNKQLEVHK